MKQWKLGVIAALLAGAAQAAPLPVVTSFSILGDVAKQVGGERVAVQSLVGANQDAHAYHMTSGDIKKIRSAKLVLLNGLGLEGADVQRAVKQSKVPFAEATKNITALKAEEGGHHHHHHHDGDHDHDHDHHHHHDHGEFDPHVWTDPVLMVTYAQNVGNALIQADPEGKAYYQQRLTAYQNQLKKLHSDAQAAFGSVPADKRKVLTAHDAFSYMAKRYNVSFIAPQGVSSAAEPSAKQVASIIRQIKREGINAVFVENIKDTRMVDRIAKETGVRVSGKLYSDALGSAPADTYIGMYRYNVKALTDAMKK
ncbi:metal ABC transporter solute-binding protein, Zn/Mn family [Neisseria lisongii]|uniref:Zinc ABC transporter substrate-binding protein n=1 Tax=Neisseria lisongii TaxID=2912188 RepID=A0AAW5AMT1_9NEIS|nr:zinc ABC transporter substrate-binding protein [Neisseria lisongii]MCF7529397.1 zinc ABC transporter substrate-binding protein [Neisseria lisongii]